MLTVITGGDYYPVKEIHDYHIKTNQPSKLFGDLLPILKKSDYAIYNQEYPLTKGDKEYLKFGANLKGDPLCINALKNAGFNIATLANNHTLDFGIDGMLETVKTCKDNNIEPIGWGKTFEDSRKPFIIDKNGIRIAVINCAENEFNTATNEHGGAYPLNVIDNVRLLKETKRKVDHIIMIIHGGTDFCHYPSLRMQEQYRFYAENGASIIIGHHTHMVSGYEVFNNVPIFYSLGNLIYPYTWNKECQETIIIKLMISKNKIDFEIIPFYFSTSKMQLIKIEDMYLEDFNLRFKMYSNALEDKNILLKKWSAHIDSLYTRTVYFSLLTRTPYVLHKVARKLNMLSVFEKFVKKKDKRMLALWNLHRCETHRDAVQYIFSKLFNNKKDV